MPRLRTVSPNSPGWTRRRSGKGFVYLDEDGDRLSTDAALRCRQLVIPAPWNELWICPADNGHIQAVGTDDAGRRQYMYHWKWREQAEQEQARSGPDRRSPTAQGASRGRATSGT